jgi:hypothetical protein
MQTACQSTALPHSLLFSRFLFPIPGRAQRSSQPSRTQREKTPRPPDTCGSAAAGLSDCSVIHSAEQPVEFFDVLATGVQQINADHAVAVRVDVFVLKRRLVLTDPVLLPLA